MSSAAADDNDRPDATATAPRDERVNALAPGEGVTALATGEGVTALLRESINLTVDGVAPAFERLRGDDPIPADTIRSCKNLLVAVFAASMHVGDGAVSTEQVQAIVEMGRRVRQLDGAAYLLDACGLYLLRGETRDETLLTTFMTCVFSPAFHDSVRDPRGGDDYRREPAYLAIRQLWADKVAPRGVQHHAVEEADRAEA